MFSKIVSFFKGLRVGHFNRDLMRYFDWPLFLLVIAISLFGVVTIFSATSTGGAPTLGQLTEFIHSNYKDQ